jgi:haloalkane dehalogenase
MGRLRRAYDRELTWSASSHAKDGTEFSVLFARKSSPAFVMLHGFPDNGHIYDDLIPHLVAGGRRAITIDFLGFGASDKPEGAQYSFAQQRGDVEAVLDALQLDKVVLVGHDAGGPAALNLALLHPERVASVVLMNVFYGEAPGLLVPELIELFSHKPLQALAQHFLTSPQQFAWLLEFQRQLLLGDAAAAGQTRYQELLGPLIDDNFRQQPSAAVAFAQMTSQLKDEVAANTGRLVALRPLGGARAADLGQERPLLASVDGGLPSGSAPQSHAPRTGRRALAADRRRRGIRPHHAQRLITSGVRSQTAGRRRLIAGDAP